MADDDEVRFSELAWPHLDAVLRTAQCLTRSRTDAEDLAQEVMFKAFKAIGTVRDDLHAKAWLMTILRHARIDQARAAKPEASSDQLDLESARGDEAGGPRSDGIRRDVEEIIHSLGDELMIRALRELPKEIRWTLLLVDVEGIDQADAADVLGVPVGTVKSRLHRGRGMMRTLLVASTPKVRQAV